jgi:outer membrane immunogenic protein
MRLSVIVSFAISLIPSAAFSTDLATTPIDPVPPIPMYFWSGPYAGVYAGYAWARSKGVGHASEMTEKHSEGAVLDPRGLLGGAYAGYNYQFDNNLVVGIDAAGSIGDISRTRAQVIDLSTGAPVSASASASSRVDWSGSARIRFGYAFGRFLPFVAGGVSVASYVHKWNGFPNVNGDVRAAYVGPTIGAGIDYAVTNNIILRAEYAYSHFGTKGFVLTTPVGSLPYNVDLSTQEVRAGIAFKL